MVTALDCLNVTTLGCFSVVHNQVVLSGGNWNRRRVCELFKILLSAEQHRLHREQVQELLWPDFSIEQAANSFGKTLYLLRRALEPTLSAGKSSTYIALDEDILRLLPRSLEIDADLFEMHIKHLQTRTPHTLNEFDNVLKLYGGDYLPDDLYKDWAQRRRDRLRRSYSWLLEQAARIAIASAQGQRASEYLRALVEQNTLDEAMHYELMLIYARIGRRSEALNQYQVLRKILHEELRATPAPKTLELYRTIQDGCVTPDLADSLQMPAQQPAIELSNIPVHTHMRAISDDHTTDHRELVAAVPQPALQNSTRETANPPNNIFSTVRLVGRTRELQRLQQTYASASKGVPWIFFVSGEAGIGKTRLARECAVWVQETAGDHSVGHL